MGMLVMNEHNTSVCSKCGKKLGNRFWADVPGNAGNLCLECHDLWLMEYGDEFTEKNQTRKRQDRSEREETQPESACEEERCDACSEQEEEP
jgi:hypothetical protein